MKTTVLAPPVIISVTEFNVYSTQWVSVVDNPDGSALQSSFKLSNQQMAVYVSLPLQSLIGLCSAVGAQFIKTRFLVQANGRFTLGLYAADANGIQLTAYYLADDQVAVPNLEDSRDIADAGGEVPKSLADYWVALWAQYAPTLTAHQFASNYGHLRGYTFDHLDFVDTLAKVKLIPAPNAKPKPEPRLRIQFALHEYVRPDATTPDQSFGLVLQLVIPKTTTTEHAATDKPDSVAMKVEAATGRLDSPSGQGVDSGGDPFYDMSQPCPPHC